MIVLWAYEDSVNGNLLEGAKAIIAIKSIVLKNSFSI